jgi:hypothetical protein
LIHIENKDFDADSILFLTLGPTCVEMKGVKILTPTGSLCCVGFINPVVVVVLVVLVVVVVVQRHRLFLFRPYE